MGTPNLNIPVACNDAREVHRLLRESTNVEPAEIEVASTHEADDTTVVLRFNSKRGPVAAAVSARALRNMVDDATRGGPLGPPADEDDELPFDPGTAPSAETTSTNPNTSESSSSGTSESVPAAT